MKHLYKNPALFILIHLFLSILCLSFLILYFNRQEKVFLLITIMLIVIVMISIVISLNSWNAKIYFTKEEIYYYYGGKKYSWRWEDIISCEIKSRFLARGNPLSYYFEVTSSRNEKTLVFEYSPLREKFLMSICPLENIKEVFEKSFNTK